MSKKVKILLGRDIANDDYDYYSQKIVQSSISDWEEISEDDYKFLRDNLYRLFNDYSRTYNLSPFLVVMDETPVIERIKSIKTYIDQEKRRDEQAKAKAESKKAERAAMRLLKKAKTEKDLYEMLKGKFEKNEKP